MKIITGYFTILGATVGLGYWYHLTDNRSIGACFFICLVILLLAAIGMIISDN